MQDIDFASVSNAKKVVHLRSPKVKPREVEINKDFIDLKSASLSVEDAFDKAIAKMEMKESSIEVKDDKSNEEIVMVGTNGNKLLKAIDGREKEILTPVKAFQAKMKKYKDRLKALVQSAKQKTGQYQYHVELERRKQQEAIRKANEELQKKLDAEAKKSGIEAPKVEPVTLPKEDKVVRTEDGSTSHLRRPWKGRIVDPDKVPHQYCEPSQIKINQAVKMGIREIPGVEIKQEIETVFK